MDYQDFVFLDTETTGMNPLRDRIIEVGLYCIVQGKKELVWSRLLNPESVIPYFIQNITAIDNAMVEDAPVFADIAAELAGLLHGKIIVAHNARFDYAFLKNEFKRCQIDFKEKTLCTVKLSRHVFPQEKKHNLDAIKARFNLVAEGRHRALADVELMYQFFQLVQNSLAPENFQNVIKQLIKMPSLPMHIAIEDIQHIPQTAGIYKFFDETDSVIYVGKSVSLRDRVLSHFSADCSSYKEMRLAQQVKRIEWVETVGEFGALLMEALMVKEELPVHNRRLRKHRALFTIQVQGNSEGYALCEVISFSEIRNLENQCYGIFRTKTDAKAKLAEFVNKYQLCNKLLGLEKTKGSCFNYQLKKCQGACIKKETASLYNLRVKSALIGLSYKPWPYAGKVALIEHCIDKERVAYHIFDQWCYLGTHKTEVDLSTIQDVNAGFDIDVYKLLKKNLPLFAEKNAILEIRYELECEGRKNDI